MKGGGKIAAREGGRERPRGGLRMKEGSETLENWWREINSVRKGDRGDYLEIWGEEQNS